MKTHGRSYSQTTIGDGLRKLSHESLPQLERQSKVELSINEILSDHFSRNKQKLKSYQSLPPLYEADDLLLKEQLDPLINQYGGRKSLSPKKEKMRKELKLL